MIFTFDDCSVQRIEGNRWVAIARTIGPGGSPADDPDGVRAEFTIGPDLDPHQRRDDVESLHTAATRALSGEDHD